MNFRNKFLVSYDVTSLFTNISLQKTIDLAVDLMFKGVPGLRVSRPQLRKLFVIATTQSHFLFKGEIYEQIDGVAMGSPLAPTLANLFMGHHEQMWSENCGNDGPVYYQRYVDDIFVVFDTETQADEFLGFLNTRHPSIRFTA